MFLDESQNVSSPLNGSQSQSFLNTQASVNDQDEEDEKIEVGHYSSNRKFKDWLIARLLCRWWYVFPDWPPQDFDFDAELEKRKFRAYKVEEFEEKDNIDKDGYTKVYQVTAFPGVYRDYNGVAHDLRPLEGKPCYNNYSKFSESKLFELVEKGIRKQLEILSTSKYDERPTLRFLREELQVILEEKKSRGL
ncbi:hypothetical protein MACK_002076 [Theileria orientalis]|uniref:Uncharacterized protein n=1 Tax=Theileria orientalis TaxID=68886 RepID=A0A976MDN1_THEOR|nr:hypothetical protein MACK_002076 [Theileria orientalis]